MHSYDTVLKLLLADSENTLFERITGAKRVRPLNVELPSILQFRVDLLFETLDLSRRLIQLELQSRNDPGFALRMALYALLIYRRFQRFPEQYVLYVGNEPLRLPTELRGPDFFCRYRVVDVSTIDAEDFLKSSTPADTVLAILGHTENRPKVIRRILERIVTLEQEARVDALSKLTILAGLRKLGEDLKHEVKGMPILDDIMDHDLLGPAIRQGIEQGREQGKQQEAASIIRQLLTIRFGPLPQHVSVKLSEMPLLELEALTGKILKASHLEDLFSTK